MRLLIYLALLVTLFSPIAHSDDTSSVVRDQVVSNSIMDLDAINSSLLSFWQAERRWPASLNELASMGYFSGNFQTPTGSLYMGMASVDGASYTVNFSLSNPSYAQSVANQIANGTHSGAMVSTTIGRPTDSNLMPEVLGRASGGEVSDRMTMESNLDLGGHNLNRGNAINGQSASGESLTTDSLQAEVVRLGGRAVLGSNTIAQDGNALKIDTGSLNMAGAATIGSNLEVAGATVLTGETTINSNLIANRNVVSSGGDLTGFGTADGVNANFDTVTSEVGNIQRLTSRSAAIADIKGESLSYNSGNLKTSNAQSVHSSAISSTNVHASNSVANSIDAVNGNIANLRGNSAHFTTGTSNNTDATALSVNGSAKINSVTATDINAGEIVADTAQLKSMTSGRLTVGGRVTSQNLRVDGVTAADSLNVTSNANIGTVESTAVHIDNLTANSLSRNDLSVTSQSLNATGLGKLGTLTVNGAAQAAAVSSANVVASNELKTGSLNANSAVVTTVGGNAADFNRVTSSQFVGGNYTATNDFSASSSSVNANHGSIKAMKGELDDCMYVTQHCFPKAPVISNVSCVGCSQSSYASTFSATLNARVSQCQQGCSYSWSASGGASGTCAAGVIPRGVPDYRDVSCTISGSPSEGSAISGAITLLAQNLRRTNLAASASRNYSFTRVAYTTPGASLACGGADGCFKNKTTNTFSAVFSVSTSNCTNGCGIAWTVPSLFTKVSGCTTGSTCTVSYTMPPGQTKTITEAVRVKVFNSAAPSKFVERTVTAAWTYTYDAPPPVAKYSTGTSCSKFSSGDTLTSPCTLTYGDNPDPRITLQPLLGNEGAPATRNKTTWSTQLSPPCPSCTASIRASSGNCYTIIQPGNNASGYLRVAPGVSCAGSVTVDFKDGTRNLPSKLVSFRFEHKAPEVDPIDNVVAGCYIDTNNSDTFQINACHSYFARSKGSPSKILFSVGDKRHPRHVAYAAYVDTPGWTFQWSGECASSTSYTCNITSRNSRLNLGYKVISVKITSPKGGTKTFTIRADDQTCEDIMYGNQAICQIE